MKRKKKKETPGRRLLFYFCFSSLSSLLVLRVLFVCEQVRSWLFVHLAVHLSIHWCASFVCYKSLPGCMLSVPSSILLVVWLVFCLVSLSVWICLDPFFPSFH
ncbi:MAG: hypothetical protein J3R72DRAFT_436518 [Linnemannia gamsii]|nr:MAG: hypothetical protein J3R72DRAFT_436518 [Linnemannia gamsii]